MNVCCECCVLSDWGGGLRDELITHPEESYRRWCEVVCDLETSKLRLTCPAWAASPQEKKILIKTGILSSSISGSIYDGYSQSNVFNIIFQTKKMFGPTLLKVTGDYKKLHNEEAHGTYCSPNIDWKITEFEMEGARSSWIFNLENILQFASFSLRIILKSTLNTPLQLLSQDVTYF
jgi:hypothetical protein